MIWWKRKYYLHVSVWPALVTWPNFHSVWQEETKHRTKRALRNTFIVNEKLNVNRIRKIVSFELGEEIKEDFFSSCHERGTKKQFWLSMRNPTLDLLDSVLRCSTTEWWARPITKFISQMCQIRTNFTNFFSARQKPNTRRGKEVLSSLHQRRDQS